VRNALGRDDIWGAGLAMSPMIDTESELEQFQLAYEALWLDRDRRLQVDDPKIREGMIKAMEDYTSIWRKGCTPPDAVNWTSSDNNKAFLAQTVVMTANATLSIPAALKRKRPDDYYRNAVTIDWAERRVWPGAGDRGWVYASSRVQGGRQPCAGHRLRPVPGRGRLAGALSRLRR
jgi:ABC-type glycerol-3-phosphate transport system substrate-binding protein